MNYATGTAPKPASTAHPNQRTSSWRWGAIRQWTSLDLRILLASEAGDDRFPRVGASRGAMPRLDQPRRALEGPVLDLDAQKDWRAAVDQQGAGIQLNVAPDTGGCGCTCMHYHAPGYEVCLAIHQTAQVHCSACTS